MDEDGEWYGVGSFSRWAGTWATNNKALFCALCVPTGAFLAYDETAPWKAIPAGLVLVVLAGLVIAVSAFVSLFSDELAVRLLHKIFKQPDPKNLLHQLTHIILSVIVFVPLLMLMTGDDTR